MIDPNEVEKVFVDCLYNEEEVKSGNVPEGAIMVEGIIQDFGFNPQRLEKHTSEIVAWLAELPDEFHEKKGGGWTFLNACNTKTGEQWTGLHERMEQLFCLGIAIKKAKYLLPRAMWSFMPGGMPYLVIVD